VIPASIKARADVRWPEGTNAVPSTAPGALHDLTERWENVERVEIERVLEDVRIHYGVDLRGHAYPSSRRRLERWACAHRISGPEELRARLLAERPLFDRFLRAVAITVTGMFRDPPFYMALRSVVAPLLEDRPQIRIWHAGCSSGEEVFSMAILLEECGLLDRVTITATDINPAVLARAAAGVIPVARMAEYAASYHAAGGTRDLADYCEPSPEGARISPLLLKACAFARHDLADEPPVPEVDMIVCRNVMIYFERSFKQQVQERLDRSLRVGGILALGSRETLHSSPLAARYSTLGGRARIYRKES
jgi:chemotaxis protein methyltransferase CheR